MVNVLRKGPQIRSERQAHYLLDVCEKELNLELSAWLKEQQ